MAEWRFGRGWSDEELKARLRKLGELPLNFPATGPLGPSGDGWSRYYSEATIAREVPGPVVADGPFERAWRAIEAYEFSDPGIVAGHFDPRTPLRERSMLLEIKVLGLRYLCAARVGALRDRSKGGAHVRGFRYDTLDGHVEAGSEWFMLTKNEKTGEVSFRIHASWRPGQFPNWWSRLGFRLVARRYQLAWHRLAYLRLREAAGGSEGLSPVPEDGALFHAGGDMTESDLWILTQPSAPARVLVMGSRDKHAGLTHLGGHQNANHKEKLVECGGARSAVGSAKPGRGADGQPCLGGEPLP